MLEPLRPRVRHTNMTRVLSAIVATLLFLAGCGSAEQGSADEAGSEPSGSSSPAQPDAASDPVCTTAAGASRVATDLATLDLDGDGRLDVVRLTSATDPCPGQLVAEIGGRDVVLALPTDEPSVSSAFAATVPGHPGDLLVTRQDHPRGGFQLRVYAAEDGKLAELKVDGQALVPFIALDVQEHPLSIDCTDGGVVVTEAVAHEPPGVAFAWDIKQTTYTLEGTTVTAGPTEEIADNVLPDQLEAKYPDLVKHTAFTSCRSDA